MQDTSNSEGKAKKMSKEELTQLIQDVEMSDEQVERFKKGILKATLESLNRSKDQY